jgi:hypothetical protein
MSQVCILETAKIAYKYVKPYGKIIVQKNRVRTILADYMVHIENPSNEHHVLFVTKVKQDDLLRQNSQFNKNFKSSYYVNQEVLVTEALDNKLKKIIIINNRRQK